MGGFVAVDESKESEKIKEWTDDISTLAILQSCEVVSPSEPRLEQAIGSVVNPQISIYIKTEGDISGIIAKKSKEVAKKQKYIQKLEKKMSKPQYAAKTPQNIKDENIKKRDDAQKEIQEM